MTKFKLKLVMLPKKVKKYLIENCDNFFYGPDIQNLTIDGKMTQEQWLDLCIR